jgi:hypothetical protein
MGKKNLFLRKFSLALAIAGVSCLEIQSPPVYARRFAGPEDRQTPFLV